MLSARALSSAAGLKVSPCGSVTRCSVRVKKPPWVSSRPILMTPTPLSSPEKMASIERAKRDRERRTRRGSHPLRGLQEDAGEGEALLFVVIHQAVPAINLIEKRLEAFEPDVGKRLGDSGAVIGRPGSDK